MSNAATAALNWLIDEPAGAARATFILAHGAGAPMDSSFLSTITKLLTARGFRVVRFEFSYMRRRREEGGRRPPDRQPVLLDDWRKVYGAVLAHYAEPILIGGKSMGGRMATLVADELQCAGVICFGYPAHAPAKPELLRIAALETTSIATLLLQGERDPFGTREELADLALSPQVERVWLPDGDHDLKPRKASGLSHRDNLVAAADAAALWWQRDSPMSTPLGADRDSGCGSEARA